MSDERPDPDEILASLKKEEARLHKGKLKIFLGMCPGVGKTYAMLQAARQREKDGIDVLVGVAETHGRKETEALLEGMAIASKVKTQYRGTELEEMDLDTILAIRPQLAIIDELAHTNVPGSRHPKRYQDVLEILNAGIDVYTTLNVQHVESRSEAVYQITGVRIQETIPDSILDAADEITLIDLTPEQLRQRLEEGKVYLGERMVAAANNFFREQNLMALREMALRLAAEHVNQDLREIMAEQRIQGPWRTGERLMVAVGPTPFSESLIRWTRRSAAGQNASWIAAYIKTPSKLSERQEQRLNRNLTLARQLGAEVIVRSGTDVPENLLQVARQNNVTQICVGKPMGNPIMEWFAGGSLVRRLIHQSGDIDIHMVRVRNQGIPKDEKRPVSFSASGFTARSFGISLAIVAGVTLLCMALKSLIGYSAVALIYLLTVMLLGVYLSRWAVLFVAACSALSWNYLFIPPEYTFRIYKTYDAIMFVTYFVVALIMGHIASRLREREKAEREQEAQVNALYRLTKAVAVTRESKEAIQNALNELEKILDIEGAIFLVDAHGRADLSKPQYGKFTLSAKERSVANWAFQRKLQAGRYTETLPESSHLYLPFVSMEKSLGVLAVKLPHGRGLSLDHRNLLESFASLMTVILEKDIFTKFAQDAKLKEESEKLQSALLDSVSHELKTPLTVISGSIEHLKNKKLSPDNFHQVVDEIRTAAERLHQTVNSLLDMTRLDSGELQLNIEWQDVRDLITSVIEQQKNPSRIEVEYLTSFPLVKMDAAIIRQVVSNLLSNALSYSPPDSKVKLTVDSEDKNLVVNIMDRGSGIQEDDLDKVFDKFYRGKGVHAGGLGLGLSIAKRFVEALGGEISVRNREDGGACFSFRIPVDFFNPQEDGAKMKE